MRTTLRATQLISQGRNIFYPYHGLRITSLKEGGFGIMAVRPGGPDLLIGKYSDQWRAINICEEIMYAVSEGKERYWLPKD